MTSVNAPARSNLGLLAGLVAVAVCMLSFGIFAMPSLYSLWCRLSGTQTNPNNTLTAGLTDRWVTAYFEAVNFDKLPVRFWPDAVQQRVQVGAEAQNTYHFENLSDQPVHFRPIHQISPVEAGTHFGMRICFCFIDQTVGPRETKSFPVVYRFAPELDRRTTIVTLRYGLFAIDPKKPADPDEIKRQEARMGAGIVSPPRIPHAVPAAPAAKGPP